MDDADGLELVASKMAAAIREFALKLLGPGAEQFGLMGGDWTRLWREKNLLAIKDKYDRIVRDKEIEPANPDNS